MTLEKILIAYCDKQYSLTVEVMPDEEETILDQTLPPFVLRKQRFQRRRQRLVLRQRVRRQRLFERLVVPVIKAWKGKCTSARRSPR